MATDLAAKARRFQELHAGPGAFVVANAWDAGSARMLASLGFPALATSSGAAAGTLGRRDGRITREEAIAHARTVAAATDLPVSGDLENGFGDTPEDAAITIRAAVGVGLCGGSIEDYSGRSLYSIDLAATRIEAAVAAARASATPFVLTARAENFIRGNPDLDDTIRRLKAYEAAGADVLMAPGLPDLDAVRKVCGSLAKPFNFMGGIKGRSFGVADLAAAGVRRVSLATSLYRAAMTGLLTAAREVKETGSFGYLDTTLATPEMNAFMQD
ncbi:MAG: isocitrate lyase/phosphoenolpyruvate mutase family protein [Hyphomicrobiaceae bacterium]|nr:isocitrate lyase/phosphoenolpyruvate mutase family protein [Hyphomicrobiaceae bacterium]